MSSHYEHTQTGGMWLIGGGSVVLLFLGNEARTLRPRESLFLLGIVLLVLLAFSALTVSVDHSQITVRFGISPLRGWFRKRISLNTVKDCGVVRNSWLHGVGIRHIGHGWLYNVAGLDAVELHLTNGRRIRIGTDEPDALAAAIAQARDWDAAHPREP